LAFLQALNIQKVTLAGHSMGGQIAIGCALTAPNLVKDLLLFAPAGFEYYTPEEAILFESAIRFGNFLNMDELHIAQSINASFFQTSADSKKIIDTLNEYIQKNNRNIYRRMLDLSISSMLKEQIFYDLQKITQPVLVFFGEDDMLIPNRFLHPISTSEIARKACNEIKQSFLFTYPQTGHFVQIERAVEVNHTIQQYFKGQNPGL
jgi:pimeloyl-ACP methyl ester carboxylesterase